MHQPSSEIKYEKMSGFATTKGQMYEAKVSALLFLRGINSGFDFQLASNVKGAGALDDVVFRFKDKSVKWTSYFIQLKHKENSSIKREMLTTPTGTFSLQKYCESYEEIKKAMSATERKVLFDGNIEDCFPVIFTNAKPNSDLGEERGASEQIDEFLGSNSGNVFSFEPDRVTEVGKAISDSLHDCSVDCGLDFLKRLRIFAAQPCEAEFDSFIKKELEKSVHEFKNIDIDRLFACLIENVKTWCEEKRNILDRGSDLLVSARDRVLAETSSIFEVKANKLDLVFAEEALLPLKEVLSGEFPVVHIGSSEQSSRLTCTKLLQTLESSTYLFFGSESFLSNLNAVISEWGRGRHNTLIVSVNNRNLATDQCHFEKIVKLFKTALLSKKRLVILTDSEIRTESGLEYLDDTFSICNLTAESRKDFLCTKFLLQGRSISLETFLADCCDKDILSGPCVVEIMEHGQRMSVGSDVTGPDEHYLRRSLHPPHAKVLRSLFLVETLPETIAIVNSTISDVEEIFLQNDEFLNKQHLHPSLHFSASLFPDKTNKTIFFSAGFLLGKFEFNFVGVSKDKPCALRIRPRIDGRPLSTGWFLFVYQGTIESAVDKLAEFHLTNHYLKLKNSEFTLSKSLNDSNFIREHIELLRPKDSVDVRDRVVIVCGEPGMGKTTLMRHLAQRTKEAHPHLWVILISLNNNTQLFTGGKNEDAFAFLSAAAKVKSPLERSLFRLALEVTGNVVVILDGYDEIAPKYAECCCQLLSSLLKTKVKKVWVTTRISVKSELESHLSLSATRLCKFNDDDQRHFLKRYLLEARDLASALGEKVLSDEELDQLINQLLKITVHSFRDWRSDFLGIPLHANIMGEVFKEHVAIPLDRLPLPNKLDLLQLLERFIQKKLEVYVRDKLKIKPSDTNYELLINNSRTTYLTNHMEAAIWSILPEKYGIKWQTIKLIRDPEVTFEKIENGGENTGFVNSIINGKAHFVHRVFAEYFVAKWFALNPAEYAKFIEEESYYSMPTFAWNLEGYAEFTVGEPYHAYRGRYVVSRYLCDLILAKDCELHTAVLYGDVDKVKELLAAGADVNARDLGGRTPLHMTASFGHMNSTHARHVEILDLLIQTPGIDFELTNELVNGTPLRYADMAEYWLMIEMLLEHDLNKKYLDNTLRKRNSVNFIEFILSSDSKNLLEFCIDKYPDFPNEKMFASSKLNFKGCSLLANACQHGNLRIVKLLIERGYNINGQTESLHDSLYPPLHCASLGGHLEIVKLLVKASKCEQGKRLSQVTTGRSDFVNRKAVFSHTAIHLASYNGYENVVAFLIDHGAYIESQDDELCTCLHYAARKNHLDVLKVIANAVERKNKLEFVSLSNYLQSTPLHLAAQAGFLEAVKILVSAGGTMTIDRYKQTPLMLAARNGHLVVVEFLLAALDKDRNANGICNSLSRTGWLNKKDKDGWTALTLAESFGFQNVVELLTDRGASTRKRDGPDTGLPKDYKHEEETLHGWKSGYSYCVHFNCIDNVGHGVVVYSDFDGHGNTMLHIASRLGYLELVDILVKLGAKLLSRNNAGQTPLMMAAGKGHFRVVENLINAFDKSNPIAKDVVDMNDEVVSQNLSKVKFINMKDRNGVTALYHAAFRTHTFTVELLMENGAEALILPYFGRQVTLFFSATFASVSWSVTPPQWVKTSKVHKKITLTVNIEIR